MWTLRSLTPGAEDPYHLLVGVEYVVGRKNCAILLHNDQSISRSHAVLLVSHPIANLSQTASIPVLTLKDTSKYGTFVNEERLQNDSPRSLKSGEIVVFGIFQSKFRVGYKPLIVCSSCLVGPGKITLNQAIQQLGGHVTSNWTNDNTHLVMPSIKITVKTICAMICGRPIVKPQFFLSVAEAIRSRQHFPSAESFSPPIDEPNIKAEDMVIKPERKWIFVGKTFIFFNGKQHKRLGPAVTLGGGNVKLIEEKGPNLSLLEAPGSCVIDVGVSDSQTASDSTKKWIDSALITLQRKGLRTISEAEVGLAVIHISTDIYCNPLSNPNSEMHFSSKTISRPTLSQQMDVDNMTEPGISQHTSYVPDTQRTNTRMNVNTTVEVKETPETDEESNIVSQDISVVIHPATSMFSPDQRPKSKKDKSRSFYTGNEEPGEMAMFSSVRNKDKNEPQSSSIHDFFQPIRRKRERQGDESTQSKFARTEDSKPSLIHQTSMSEPSVGRRDLDLTQFTQAERFSASFIIGSSTEGSKGNCEVVCKRETTGINVPDKSIRLADEVHRSNKRKGLDDFNIQPVDGILEDDAGPSREEWLVISKRRKVEPEDLSLPEKPSKAEFDHKLLHSDKRTSEVKQKTEILDPLAVSLNESNNHEKLFNEAEYNEMLPSKLLLTVFKTLVNHTRQKIVPTSNADNSQVKNFKKFRKVLYPGGEGLPRIIGGTDLKAYQTKNNSEMEEWLRQEIEEQSQQAKDDILADDLFRYDPKSVKRRR
uniref:Nibrin n=1 Tax=Callorhinchus milii TaxID=7868 RepID=V9KFB8_CALMI